MVPFLILNIFLYNINNIQKCGVGRFFMYWNEVSSVHQGYIYLRKKKIYIYIIYSCALFRMFLEIILIC